MPDLETIRQGVKTVLEDAISGLTVYAMGETVHGLPAGVLIPSNADFTVTMGRGTDTWTFDLVVMVATGELAHPQLDELVAGSGPRSIRQAIFKARKLGLSDLDAHVSELTSYNVALSSVEVDHVAATLRLIVHTKGLE